MFDALRQELLVQRAQVAERLSALEQAEAAFVRLQQVLGIEDAAESVQEPPTEAMAEAGPPLRPDPAERALGTIAEQQAVPAGYQLCEGPGCTIVFEVRGRGQRAKRYCSPACRAAAWTKRKAAREDAEDKAQAAAILAQHASEGYETTLKWRATNGTA